MTPNSLNINIVIIVDTIRIGILLFASYVSCWNGCIQLYIWQKIAGEDQYKSLFNQRRTWMWILSTLTLLRSNLICWCEVFLRNMLTAYTVRANCLQAAPWWQTYRRIMPNGTIRIIPFCLAFLQLSGQTYDVKTLGAPDFQAIAMQYRLWLGVAPTLNGKPIALR